MLSISLRRGDFEAKINFVCHSVSVDKRRLDASLLVMKQKVMLVAIGKCLFELDLQCERRNSGPSREKGLDAASSKFKPTINHLRHDTCVVSLRLRQPYDFFVCKHCWC